MMDRQEMNGMDVEVECEDSEYLEVGVTSSESSIGTNKIVKKKKANKAEVQSPHFNFHIHNISKKPNEIRLPRIPKEDIRKQYPQMFLNIMNSMDFNLIASFYEECCSKNISFHREVVSSLDHSRQIQSCIVQGVEEIVLLLWVVNLIYPDRIFRTADTPRIITKSDTYCTEIIIDYTLTGHLIFNCDVIQAMNFILVFREQYLQRQQQYPTMQSFPMSSDEFLSEFEAAFFQRFSLLPVPEVAERQGVFLIVINNIYESEEIDEITMRSYGF